MKNQIAMSGPARRGSIGPRSTWSPMLVGIALLGALALVPTQAATVTYDFANDPAAGGFTLTGTANWQGTGGNTGGFVELNPAVDEARAALLLPDFDSGKVISAFTIEMDVRVGAGSDLPGEGYSINFVPLTAQVVANGADGPGWASDFAPTANLPERGSVEGLGVSALAYDHGGGDVVGFSVRLNQVQFALAGWIIPPTGSKVYNGACNDINTMQTGPTTGGVEGLCWQKVKLVMREGGRMDIYWKGNPVVTNFPSGWTPSAGRFILGSRTATAGSGGGSEVHHVDNIVLTTVLADKPTVASFLGGPLGFSYTIQDLPSAVLDPASVTLKLDGATVTATSITKAGTVSTVTYNAPSTLTPLSSHTASIDFQAVGGPLTSAANTFSVPAYVVVPPNLAVPGVNTGNPGFRVRPYQTSSAQPNDLQWTEQQLAGAKGPNIADLSGADSEGFYIEPGVISYDVVTDGANGRFNPSAPFPGLPTGDAPNSSIEVLTYLHFPAAGAYTLGVNSDDGFKVSTALNVSNPNGLVLGQFNGGRGAADTFFTLVIQSPGYYPVRLIWENGAGGANCEWYSRKLDGSYILVNDTTDAGAIRAYRSGPAGPPFVESFNGSLAGFAIVLKDGSTSVEGTSITTRLNGTTVTPSINSAGTRTLIDYVPPVPLPSPSTNVVTVAFSDNGTPALRQTNTYSFLVAGASVPPSDAVVGVDLNNPGFLYRPHQVETPAGTVLETVLSTREEQLAGLAGPNIADLTGAVAGTYTVEIPLNLNIDPSAERGNFTSANGFSDSGFPGLPGTTGLNDSATAEILTWVYFPTQGTYTMGVNSDDGFKVTLGRNPADQFALVLGLFDGGRGASDTVFQFYIPTAGFYPMRLLWNNGGGEANLEWFSVNPDGTKVLLNDNTSPGALQAYHSGPTDGKAYTTVLTPGMDERNVSPDTAIRIWMKDGTTQVNAGFVGLTLNGTATAPTISNVGGITKVLLPGGLLASGSTNTATLTYQEVGSTASVTKTWRFVVANYNLLPPELATPVGSGDASKPGFRYRVDQIPPGFNNTVLQNQVERAEQNLELLWGPGQAISSSNIASPTSADVPGVINFNVDAAAEIGDFTSANGFADALFPGLPGTTGSNDNTAAEAVAFVEFPTAGYYTMGVNSDDCFRVSASDKNIFLGDTLYVNTPASLAGRRIPGTRTWSGDGGFGGRFPWPPITAKVIPADPITACGTPANCAALAGNIALIQRGTCEFGFKALRAQECGAIAVLIFNNRQDLPIGLGAGAVGGSVTIPVMMIHQNDGSALATAAATSEVWATIGSDPTLALGQFNTGGGRGSADTWFSFGVAQAGVYPLRLVWNNGGGGANLEWFTVDNSGSRVLLNDTSNPNGLKAYRARTVAVPPTLQISLSGDDILLTYQGFLQTASAVGGPYADVPGSRSPFLVPTSMAARFFRVRQAN